MLPRSIHVGDILESNLCGKFIIRDYPKNSTKPVIEFLDTGYITEAPIAHIKRGTIKDKFKPSLCGVGFIGDGVYRVKSKQGDKWRYMIDRCYSDSFHEKYPTYRCCEVSEEWQCLQCFGRWYDDTYPVDGNSYELDKDFKIIGNKIYSEHTCVWLPSEINAFFVNSLNLEAGITQRPSGKWRARISEYSQQKSAWKSLGDYIRKEDALYAYINEKERLAKDLIFKYNDILHDDVINNIFKILEEKRASLLMNVINK